MEKCCKDVPKTDEPAKICKDFKAADCPKDTNYTPYGMPPGTGTASKETCCFKTCKAFKAADCKAPKVHKGDFYPCVKPPAGPEEGTKESGTAHVTPTVAASFLSMLAMVGCSV